ncbi:LysM peptidoglycan-binding domain-containing protein [Brevibacillus sp. H7]|uniref:LysM peptidoglycan-binding domain-containing protein n=1 Tax=Brevibacillus sp. H7 TaxID=3349138 RepID=UPI003817A587
MALQDGLLSFQIKETIFLSSDKTGIGELKELELVPDVEIIENPTEISITGCLQLHGKYEPVRSTSEDAEGGADTLVSAMKFTPLRFERNDTGLYGSDAQLAHRIPLNITIPSNRVADIEEIYAIVDSFDYQLEGPNQLVIEAELKIAGIVLTEQQQQAEAAEAEEWEFVHVASEQDESVVRPATLDDIERKLAELEQEIARQEVSQQEVFQQESTRELPLPYIQPYVIGLEPPEYAQTFHQQTSEGSSQHFGDVSSDQDSTAENAAQPEEDQIEAVWESNQVTEVAAKEEEVAQQDQPLEAQNQETEQQNADAEPAEETVAAEADAVETSVQEAEEIEEQAAEEKEMRVAISSKPSKQESGSLNLTSIFTQARRAQENLAAESTESSSSASRMPARQQVDSSMLEAMHNLTSFVRNKEERYSRLKLCIIQRDETLESISMRYSLPVSKIVEVNKLTSDRIVEGQILYIPQ